MSDEAEMAWFHWRGPKVGYKTKTGEEAFIAGFEAGKRIQAAIKDAGPAAAEPGFLERTFGVGDMQDRRPDPNLKEDE